jgi:mannitol operon transcriptional antiterminator
MKSYLNTRQFEILSALLKNEKPITVEELSNLLDIKPRVVQYNLNAIDCWLNNNHIKMIRRSGYGLRVELTNNQRKALVEQLSGLNDVELIISTRERQRCLLLKLISDEEAISSGKLGADFCVSRSTILTDMIQVETKLNQFHLSLAKDIQKGFSVQGQKSLKRFAMSALFCEEHFENKTPLGNMNMVVPSKRPFPSLITNWFTPQDTDFAKDTIERIEHILKVHYSQTSRIFINYYLLFMLTDLRTRSQLTDEVGEHVRTFREASILPFLKKAIEKYTEEQICASELDLFALHLHCQAPFNGPDLNPTNTNPDPPEDKSTSLVHVGDLLKEVSLYLHPYLQIDPKYVKEFTTYVNNSSIYKQHGFSVINPFHEKTRQHFPETYDTIEKIASAKKYRTNSSLDESDIGALTIISINGLERIQQIAQRNTRVALISDTDYSLISLTKERILKNFPYFKIVGVFRPSDISHIKARNVDLILSTIELNIENCYSIVLIDQFMTNLDVEHIKNWIDDNSRQKLSNVEVPEQVELGDLLKTKNIVFCQAAKNWEEAVYLVGKPLIDNGDINNSYLDAIIQITKTYGPYSVVSPGIALLHAKSSEGVNKLCLGLLILKSGVNFGAESYDPVHIIFTIGIPDSHSHLHALRELVNIIRTRNISKILTECASAEDAIRIIASKTRNKAG